MINIQTILDFLIHRFKGKTRHGVHSPFVYRLVDEVIYDFHTKSDYAEIEKLRTKLLKDERSITITDLGAGSMLSKNNEKQVRFLAKNALKSPALAQLIYRLAADIKPRNIIELGTCLGITSAYLAKAAPNAQVITIEGCPATANIARENLNSLDIQNTELLTGNFDNILPNLLKNSEELDFVYVDGNHRKDATLNYFEWCLPKLSPNSIMIFDDIYWSKGMKEAWAQIKARPEVSVSVDLFWIGLIFVRKGQAKEDFTIRY
jgi:predicted O-methyltransferase YrrM